MVGAVMSIGNVVRVPAHYRRGREGEPFGDLAFAINEGLDEHAPGLEGVAAFHPGRETAGQS